MERHIVPEADNDRPLATLREAVVEGVQHFRVDVIAEVGERLFDDLICAATVMGAKLFHVLQEERSRSLCFEDRRAVEKEIDLAELVVCLFDHPGDFGFGRDIGLNADRVGSGFLGQLSRRVFDPVAIDIDDGNLDAFARQITSAGVSHSSGAPGN